VLTQLTTVVRPTLPVVLQALPMLQAKFPIQRARMRLKLSVPTEAQEALLEELDGKGGVVESTDMAAGGNTFIAIAQVSVHEWHAPWCCVSRCAAD
jgi:hypothetical protein